MNGITYLYENKGLLLHPVECIFDSFNKNNKILDVVGDGIVCRIVGLQYILDGPRRFTANIQLQIRLEGGIVKGVVNLEVVPCFSSTRKGIDLSAVWHWYQWHFFHTNNVNDERKRVCVAGGLLKDDILDLQEIGYIFKGHLACDWAGMCVFEAVSNMLYSFFHGSYQTETHLLKVV